MLDRTNKKPRVYFAGKISAKDWRGEIFGGKRSSTIMGSDGVHGKRNLFDPRYTEDYSAFTNGGPFYIWEDHIGINESGQHGIGIDTNTEDMRLNRSAMLRRAAIFKVNLQRLRRADIVFTYINEADCFGTIVEMGQAQVFGKETHIGFGPNAPYDEMWMLRGRAKAVYMGTPKTCWRQFSERRLAAMDFG